MAKGKVNKPKIADTTDICFFPKTKELLEKEVAILEAARDGVGTAYNVLKRKGIVDNHLQELYNEFDGTLKEYNQSISALIEQSEQFCVCK